MFIRELSEATGSPTTEEMKSAILDIYQARAHEAQQLGREAQTLPIVLKAYPHWETDYTAAAKATGLELSLEEAIEQANSWLGSLLEM